MHTLVGNATRLLLSRSILFLKILGIISIGTPYWVLAKSTDVKIDDTQMSPNSRILLPEIWELIPIDFILQGPYLAVSHTQSENSLVTNWTWSPLIADEEAKVNQLPTFYLTYFEKQKKPIFPPPRQALEQIYGGTLISSFPRSWRLKGHDGKEYEYELLDIIYSKQKAEMNYAALIKLDDFRYLHIEPRCSSADKSCLKYWRAFINRSAPRDENFNQPVSKESFDELFQSINKEAKDRKAKHDVDRSKAKAREFSRQLNERFFNLIGNDELINVFATSDDRLLLRPIAVMLASSDRKNRELVSRGEFEKAKNVSANQVAAILEIIKEFPHLAPLFKYELKFWNLAKNGVIVDVSKPIGN